MLRFHDGEIARKLHWFVELSNGQTVYQDDSDHNSWINDLLPYLHTNNLSIKSFKIRFRSHVETIGQGDGGYSLSYMVAGVMGGRSSSYYKVGLYNGGDRILCKKVLVPEIIVIDETSENTEGIIGLYVNPNKVSS